MSTFKQLEKTDNIKEILKSAFDSDLPVSGSWGYTKDDATFIDTSDIPAPQIEHVFASMRAYIEMNMTLPEEERYGSINLNEQTREELTLNNQTYHKVTYELTAMQEVLYKSFIKEYKEAYGTKSFDLSEHFERRKEATLTRSVIHWFALK